MLLADPPQRLLHLPVEQDVLERLVAQVRELAADPGRVARARPRSMITLRRIANSQVRSDPSSGSKRSAGPPGPQEGVLDGLLGQPGVLERAQREPVELAGVGGIRLAHARLLGQEASAIAGAISLERDHVPRNTRRPPRRVHAACPRADRVPQRRRPQIAASWLRRLRAPARGHRALNDHDDLGRARGRRRR